MQLVNFHVYTILLSHLVWLEKFSLSLEILYNKVKSHSIRFKINKNEIVCTSPCTLALNIQGFAFLSTVKCKLGWSLILHIPLFPPLPIKFCLFSLLYSSSVTGCGIILMGREGSLADGSRFVVLFVGTRLQTIEDWFWII